MTSNDDEQRFAHPPRLAQRLLRVFCARARLEEIEGDLHELYARRLADSGVARARVGFVIDVFDVCVRQTIARVGRVPLLQGTYVLRIRACLVLAAALLVGMPGHWVGNAPTMLVVMDGVFELIVLVGLMISLGKQLISGPRLGENKMPRAKR
jgi:hypothetical protein